MPWHEWEDYRNGLYVARSEPDYITAARNLLCDPDAFLETATEMVRAWPLAAHQNLHNMWTGRNAWLGQASCLYAVGATSIETRAAWGTMTNHQQRDANRTATVVRERWERSERDAQTSLAV